ncbi:MAG: hypothetical protein QOE77_2158 [Blastocatellia bacterium]|jgi:2-polyprenyl-3-methyl-5-hydroxy-6-metoxy-1,4-benzoquinol methylase|nr:hypothetical protein [Blastocatellia bacterium]
MTVEQAEFGWVSSDPTDAHNYLLPAICRCVKDLFGDKRVRILDLGCGNGFIASQLAQLGHSVTGIDAASDGIKIAQASYPDVDFRRGSIYEIAPARITEGYFDCVVSLEVVEHLFHPKVLFEKSFQIIKPGGRLILTTPYHGYLKNLALSIVNGWDAHFGVHWDGGHIKFFSPKTIQLMAANAGFKNIRMSGVGRIPGLWKSMIMVAER